MSRNNYAIIIADDDKNIVQAVSDQVKGLARRFGDSVIIYPAYSGLDILSLLAKNKIDVIFLDYHFDAGMNADEVISKIEDHPSKQLIILMSGRPPEELDPIIIQGHKKLGDRFRFLRKAFDNIEIQSKYLEIEDYFSNQNYPFILNYVQETLLASSTSQGKVAAMKDLIDAIIRYSFAILISDVNRLNLRKELEASSDWKINFTTKAWLSWLSDLVKFLQPYKNQLFMPELLSVLENSEKDGPLHFLSILADELQDVLGRGYVKEESAYALIVTKYESLLKRLYDQYSFTSRYSLMVIDDIDISDNVNISYEYKVRNLMGADTKFSLEMFRSARPLKRNEVYLIDASGKELSLNPWIIYKVCAHCSLNRVFFLEEIQPEQLIYCAYCNHRKVSPQDLQEYQNKYFSLFTADYPNPYRMINIVGETNHSQVIKAWDQDLQRAVAIKSFLFYNLQSHDYLAEERLKREAQILAQFNHPNIGHVYHLLHEPLRIVMEWIDGSSLETVLNSEEILNLEKVVKIGIHLADALNYAHERDVLHRDIKPNNIILKPDFEPILIDFDIARISEYESLPIDTSGAMNFIGNKRYSAPEQFENAKVGPEADLFSLGCVLYELMTHQIPYKYGNDLSLYPNRQFPLPEHFYIPDRLFSILLRVLASSPKLRPNSKELIKELQICNLS